jgi:hypothetical protein
VSLALLTLFIQAASLVAGIAVARAWIEQCRVLRGIFLTIMWVVMFTTYLVSLSQSIP